MARDNPLQFAVVREDPELELALLERAPPGRVLLVASGGCTALELASRRPERALTLVDPNPAQLALCREKRLALLAHAPGSEGRARAFGVDRDDPESLSGRGNFESLFRGLRGLIDDLVLPAAARRALLVAGGPFQPLIEHRYWPVAFELFFSEPLLEAMFTRAATQHAPRGSYPGYFRRVIEGGLARDDVRTNHFLHQVLLGHYLPGAAPGFLAGPAGPAPELLLGELDRVPNFGEFALLSLSNVLDWMGRGAIAELAARIARECRPGALVLVRQLNNTAAIEPLFEGFAAHAELAAALLARDRSLFYERVLVLEKR